MGKINKRNHRLHRFQRDTSRDEFIKIGEKEENIHRIIEALISHINKLKAYKDLLRLEGKAKWEGNLDELRENRI